MCVSLPGLDIRVIQVCWMSFEEFPIFQYFLKVLKELLFFKNLENLKSEVMLFITGSLLLLLACPGFVRPHGSILLCSMCLKTYPFLLAFAICWHVVVHISS